MKLKCKPFFSLVLAFGLVTEPALSQIPQSFGIVQTHGTSLSEFTSQALVAYEGGFITPYFKKAKVALRQLLWPDIYFLSIAFPQQSSAWSHSPIMFAKNQGNTPRNPGGSKPSGTSQQKMPPTNRGRRWLLGAGAVFTIGGFLAEFWPHHQEPPSVPQTIILPPIVHPPIAPIPNDKLRDTRFVKDYIKKAIIENFDKFEKEIDRMALIPGYTQEGLHQGVDQFLSFLDRAEIVITNEPDWEMGIQDGTVRYNPETINATISHWDLLLFHEMSHTLPIQTARLPRRKELGNQLNAFVSYHVDVGALQRAYPGQNITDAGIIIGGGYWDLDSFKGHPEIQAAARELLQLAWQTESEAFYLETALLAAQAGNGISPLEWLSRRPPLMVGKGDTLHRQRAANFQPGVINDFMEASGYSDCISVPLERYFFIAIYRAVTGENFTQESFNRTQRDPAYASQIFTWALQNIRRYSATPGTPGLPPLGRRLSIFSGQAVAGYLRELGPFFSPAEDHDVAEIYEKHAAPLESWPLGALVVSAGVLAAVAAGHWQPMAWAHEAMLLKLVVFLAALMSWGRLISVDLFSKLHGDRHGTVRPHAEDVHHLSVQATLAAAMLWIFASYGHHPGDGWMLTILSMTYVMTHWLKHWRHNITHNSEERLSTGFSKKRRSILQSGGLVWLSTLISQSSLGFFQSPDGQPLYSLPFPPDTDADRVQSIRTRLLAFLDDRLATPQGVGATSPNDPLYQAAAAFRTAIKTHLYVIRPDTVGRAPIAATIPYTVNNQTYYQAVVSSLVFEPLLDLADDHFYADIILAIAIKEGAVAAHYQGHERQTLTLLAKVAAFEKNPFVPVTSEQQEEVRKLAGGLDERESIGLVRVMEWVRRAPLTPAQFANRRTTSAGVLAMGNEILSLWRTLSPAQNNDQRELLLKAVVINREVLKINPKIAHAVKQLPEVKQAIGPDGKLIIDKAYGWMRLDKYRFPTWTTPAPVIPKKAHAIPGAKRFRATAA